MVRWACDKVGIQELIPAHYPVPASASTLQQPLDGNHSNAPPSCYWCGKVQSDSEMSYWQHMTLALPRTRVANCLLNKFFQRKISEPITSEKAESLLLSLKIEHMNSNDEFIKCPLQFIRGYWDRLKNRCAFHPHHIHALRCLPLQFLLARSSVCSSSLWIWADLVMGLGQ